MVFFLANSCGMCVASASSVLGGSVGWGPQLTLDGIIAESYPGFFCSDNDELQPWLQIAFPDERTISSVEITNR
jgi:hypothetical protein